MCTVTYAPTFTVLKLAKSPPTVVDEDKVIVNMIISEKSLKALIVFTTGFVASYALIGCGTQSFRYTVADPISLEPTGNQGAERVFTQEGHGFVWTDCSTVNADAIDDLLDEVEAKGYESVSDLNITDVSCHWSWSG